MTYLTAALIVLAAALAAAGAAWLVGGRVGLETRKRHHEVGNPIFLQVGVMFSVLLAFVFAEVWGEFNTAAQAINRECGALHGAAMLADALPAAKGLPIERAIGAYVDTVVRVEWPAMAQGRRSQKAAAAINAALNVTATLDPTTPAEVANQAQILELLAQAHAERETRTFQAGSGLPGAVWTVLIGLAVILIGFVLFAGLERAGHIVLATAFAASTVGVLVLVKLLDYPFEGSLSLHPDDFIKTLGEVTALVAGR